MNRPRGASLPAGRATGSITLLLLRAFTEIVKVPKAFRPSARECVELPEIRSPKWDTPGYVSPEARLMLL
jgi:hypothetical protein